MPGFTNELLNRSIDSYPRKKNRTNVYSWFKEKESQQSTSRNSWVQDSGRKEINEINLVKSYSFDYDEESQQSKGTFKSYSA
mmetsp:Transcript_4888/g.4139  ORF Transcript_4888/g.4139 Transcript_4888/m.4139 type:complete len:82 (+) Transcript_4888:66-311(+)